MAESLYQLFIAFIPNKNIDYANLAFKLVSIASKKS